MRLRQPPWLLLDNVGPIPRAEVPEFVGSDTIPSSADGSDNTTDPPPPTPAEASQMQRKPSYKRKDPTPHLSYLRYLQHHQPPRTMLERFGSGYQDYLQAPLQPLTDNLESITYEVFEKDPIKYDQYFLAIQAALTDWRDQHKQASGPNGRVVVAVVGAGRGPLVTRALQASDTTGIPIETWAIEKNSNAFVLLQKHNEETWSDRVNLVKSDMRSWKGPLHSPPPPTPQTPGYTGQWPPPDPTDPSSNSIIPPPSTSPPLSSQGQQLTYHPIDILISELLGSFADNELSPECLDPILPLLNPTHGISIPQSYSAYLTPISAPKLHADIAARAVTDPEAVNTPYVVMLHAVDYLSTTSKAVGKKGEGEEGVPMTVPNVLKAWGFEHGHVATQEGRHDDDENKHNERQARLSFNLRDRAVCHGLAGYFEAVLYPGVELSTNPLTMEEKSPGMMSWFPIFFPLKVNHLPSSTPFSPSPIPANSNTQTPLYTPDFATLTASIFRATDNRKVWYEWIVEAYSNISDGRGGSSKVRLGVGERGSSRGGGCLM